LGFLATPATIAVTSPTQSVDVYSSAALGSTLNTLANILLGIAHLGNLSIAIGYQPVGGGPITIVGPTQTGLGLPLFGSTNTYAMSGVISGLATGSYLVGLVGLTSDGNTNFNTVSTSSTTALLLD
jgi:hypothetical protein